MKKKFETYYFENARNSAKLERYVENVREAFLKTSTQPTQFLQVIIKLSIDQKSYEK